MIGFPKKIIKWLLDFVVIKALFNIYNDFFSHLMFLQSMDVMDYSLLVGVDDKRKELVLGINDFMRQYA